MSGFLTLSPETTAWTNERRIEFLRSNVEAIYDELTDGLSKALRDEELLDATAERYPGLVPSRQQLAAESERRLADKKGVEIAQGLFLSHVLASSRAGSHLVWAMLRPTREALERIEDFRATGSADLGTVHVRREGRAGYLEIRNPRHLNAEDDTTLWATECAVDLILLEPGAAWSTTRGTRAGGSSARGST